MGPTNKTRCPLMCIILQYQPLNFAIETSAPSIENHSNSLGSEITRKSKSNIALKTKTFSNEQFSQNGEFKYFHIEF